MDAGSITKAYRKLAKKKHPDKGGDPEEFKALAEAYEVRRLRRCFHGFVRYTYTQRYWGLLERGC